MSTSTNITAEKTHLIRERHFSLDAGDESVLAALAQIRREHVTGTLFIDIACGGAATLRFREEQKVNFSKNKGII